MKALKIIGIIVSAIAVIFLLIWGIFAIADAPYPNAPIAEAARVTALTVCVLALFGCVMLATWGVSQILYE